MDDTKRCPRCAKTKARSAFSRNRRSRDGLCSYCKECVLQYQRVWRANNKEALREKGQQHYVRRRERHKTLGRAAHLRRKFGITPEQYDAMLAAQGGGCAICGARPLDGKRLPVDHCAETGAVRGILCDLCNRGIGALGHDAVRLARAAQYVAGQPLDALAV